MDEFFDGLEAMFSEVFNKTTIDAVGWFLLGLVVLVVGWVLAKIIAFLVYRGLHRIKTDERFAKMISSDSDVHKYPVERWISTAVFYVVLLFVLVFIFEEIVVIDALSGSLGALLSGVLVIIPNLIGAVLILVIAWVVASLARIVVTRALDLTNFDERLSESADLGKDSVSNSLSQGIFWLVYVFFLPAVLGQLGMTELVDPVQGLVTNILLGIPKLLIAAIFVFLGWVLARIVRQIVTNLLEAANVDRFGEQIGLEDEQSISDLLGLISYILILISAITLALETLELEAISGPLVGLLTSVSSVIQGLVGAAVIIGVAYYIGKLLSGFVSNVLAGLGFDTIPEKLGFDYKPAKGHRTLSDMVGYLVMVVAVLLASIEAAGLLGIQVLADSLQAFLIFGGQAIGALIILAVGVYLANLIRSIILSAGGEHASTFASVARTIVLIFVVIIAIEQLDIGGTVVTTAFTIILGAAGVAVALAFGLGARDIAGKQVEIWVKNLKK